MVNNINAAAETMTAKQFAAIHRDFRSTIDGAHFVQRCNPVTGGVMLVPVVVLPEPAPTAANLRAVMKARRMARNASKAGAVRVTPNADGTFAWKF